MAQKGVNGETVSCSICLDLLKDPVTIPCGHSYCMNCIKSFWDGEEEEMIYSCPQCLTFFAPRPVLVKNTMLAASVEELKKTELQEDVAHDVDTGRKLKALKVCLVCLVCLVCVVSYLVKLKLVEPSNHLQEKMTERQRELEGRQQNIQQGIQDREEDVKVLQQEVENINHSADKAVEESKKMLTELIRLMEKRHSDVKQQVRSQQQTEVIRVLELQEKLEQEITELKRKDAELKKLSHTEDHTHFLHNYPSVSALSEDTHSSSINIRPLRHFEDVTAAVTEATDELQDLLTQTWTNISWMVTQVDVLLSEPEPKTRAEFLKYSREITLDPNTAHRFLLISDENRKVTNMRRQQSYSDHPDRFTGYPQVLSRESLTGRCYWEVEWSGRRGVGVAVSYKNIRRAGWSDECRFGQNDKSWSFNCDNNSDNLWFNKIRTYFLSPESSRVGVYLDHRAGILSFYSVSETMTLLHRVQTTFTQPLHAGLAVYYDSTAEFIELK